jgi:hypothetical protein
MKRKRSLNKRLLIFAAGVLSLSAIGGVAVYAQTLAGTGAAIGAGATLGAAGGAGLLTPGEYARPATGAAAGAQNAQAAAMEGEPGGGGAPGAGGAGGANANAPTTPPPLKWGPDTGDDMVRQLTSVRRPARRASVKTTRRSARRASAVGSMSKTQRTKMVMSKYKKPPVGYLSWYLKEDRYKVTSKVWQFVTTPNDKFYYRPWAPAMRLRNPARVIGFHTWQDAMIAGYRPDPITKPEPGQQLAYLATLTRGPMLSRYFEYVYAGQITPAAFDANYKYVRYVARLVSQRKDTRPLVGETVEQVLGAALGLNPMPTSVGGPPPSAQNNNVMNGAEAGGMPPDAMPPGATTPPGMAPGSTPNIPNPGMDKREDQYNQFGQRAGGLAR